MPDDLSAAVLLDPKPVSVKASPTETAETAVGILAPGFRLFGLTKGQFSLLDLLRAVLSQTGPAHVVISTWTTGIRDAENAKLLMDDGVILSLSLLTDRSFPTRQPEYCDRVIEIFGEDAIRCTNTHAKFFLASNDRWKIACRSSMNLNRNPRFEQYDIDDDPVLHDFLLRHVEEMRELMPAGVSASSKQNEHGFTAAMGSDPAAMDDSPESDSLRSIYIDTCTSRVILSAPVVSL